MALILPPLCFLYYYQWRCLYRTRSILPAPFSAYGSGDITKHRYSVSLVVRDWSLIMRRGATKWENCGSETFYAPPPPPPPQDRVKRFVPQPPFKEWKLFAHPPPCPSIWLKATVYKLFQNLLCSPHPPSEWLKRFLSPLFIGVKLHMPPPSRFVATHPHPHLPVISDQSLNPRLMIRGTTHPTQ